MVVRLGSGGKSVTRRVADDALPGRSAKHPVDMTGVAACPLVCAGQRKTGLDVVEADLFRPPVGRHRARNGDDHHRGSTDQRQNDGPDSSPLPAMRRRRGVCRTRRVLIFFLGYQCITLMNGQRPHRSVAMAMPSLGKCVGSIHVASCTNYFSVLLAEEKENAWRSNSLAECRRQETYPDQIRACALGPLREHTDDETQATRSCWAAGSQRLISLKFVVR